MKLQLIPRLKKTATIQHFPTLSCATNTAYALVMVDQTSGPHAPRQHALVFVPVGVQEALFKAHLCVTLQL
jgi:hypothetical protein